MTGGGKDLKNRCKSFSYFFKFFNLVKFYIKKLLSENKLLDWCTEKNTESGVTLVNEKLRFAAYERRASAGDILGKNQLQLAEKHNPLGEKYRVQRHVGCRTVSGEITKVVSDSQGKLLDWCTEKNTESGVTLVNEKLRFAAYERRASAGGYFSEFTVSWVCEKIQNLYKKLRFERYNKNGGVGVRATRVVDFCLVRFVRFLGKVGARANFRFHATAQKLCSARGFGDISRKFRAAKFVSELKSILISFNEKINLHAARGFRNVARKFCGTHFGHYIMALFQKFPLRVANRGAILIEFAVCMPILIILLFYIHDLVKIKRYYSQTEFVAQQIANMIQNISKNRENKAVTLRELARISRLAWLSVYPESAMFFQGSDTVYSFGHTYQTMIYYVQANEDGTASCKWRLFVRGQSRTHYAGVYYTDNKGSPVRYKTNVQPSEIYPLLKLEPGQDKIIVVTDLYRKSSYTKPDGISLSNKQAFGFYLLDPKHLDENTGTWYFFHSVVIFTPKPGLFDPEKAPEVGT